MRLESVLVTGRDGIKGWTGRWDLHGVDVVAGPNGSGKTSRLLAILAGLRGVAETPTDAVREYLGTEPVQATVDLTFDATRFSRTLTDGLRTAAGKRADGAAEQICGPHLVRWDLADFASGNDQARQRLLDRVTDLGAAGWSTERIRAELGDSAAAAKLLVQTPLHGDAGELWAAAAQSWAREEYTRANAEQRRFCAEADALAIGDSEVSADTLPSLDAELGPLREQLARSRAAVDEHARLLASAARHRTAVEADRSNARRLEAEISSLAVPAELPNLNALQEAVAGARQSDAMAAEAVREQRTQIREARAGLDAIRRLAELGEARCRHCGELDPLGKHDEIAAQRLAIASLEAQLDDLESDAEIERTMRAAAEEALVNGSRLYRQAELALAFQAQLDATRARLIEREEDLAAAEAAEAAFPVTAAASDGLSRQVQELQARRDRVVRGQERERQFQLALGKRDASLEHFAAVKALGVRLKTMREDMAAAAFLPLQREASSITTPVLGREVEFRSASEFGLTRGGRWVSWWALSDGERAVTAAALSFAFARLSGAPWRAVLLDGAEVIDPSRLRLLLEHLVAKVLHGELDNAIVACRADARLDVPVGIGVTELVAP
jgi:hypothetical protein